MWISMTRSAARMHQGNHATRRQVEGGSQRSQLLLVSEVSLRIVSIGRRMLRRIYGQLVEREQTRELEGQTSINELLDDPVGVAHIQLALPIYVQLKPGDFRLLS
ncbi:hypothetical protein D477_015561 [Arthrobacter crystallopoietes BAB-32]|uniref:Uncharacterized protein n=1 Tax=Arthrobacter crystallopoietes BAB-32 TaxID=1246476 RepID=N1UZS3_9MICC|nr:hypothetical protein D477_015561 [Arthrobacter crystallopoietes BAB-32]